MVTNQILTAASLNRIRSYGDEIFDSTETLAPILDPGTKESFKAAREEYERGETVGIEIYRNILNNKRPDPAATSITFANALFIGL
jgi:hypothetical protein